jgi:pimeloyl-ACP methyl ester carboxylesterase
MSTQATGILKRHGCPIHYWIEGPADKPHVVMIHGATLDHRMFDEQVTVLLDSYRVLTLDMRGHGDSQPMGQAFTVPEAVDDLVAILDEFGIQQAILLGQSTGGYVAQELAFRFPGRVQALVMVDCICITLKTSFLDQLLLGMTPALLKLYPYNMLKKQTATQSSIRADVQAYIENAVSRISRRDYITIWRGIANCLHYESNYRVERPVLLVHGDHDKLGNIAKSAPAWVARDHCEYVVIPNAGHCSNQDNPAFFNDVLIKFLNKVAQAMI